MKTTLCLVIMCTAIIGHGPAVAADPPSPQAGDRIDLQSEAFNTSRNPFWPVGYRPASEAEKIVSSKIADLKAKINWPTLPLRGVTHAAGRNYIAIIEGVGLVEAGDIIVIERDSLIYRWMIDKVTGAGVSSTRLDVTEKVGQ